MWVPKDTFSSYARDFPIRETELTQLSAGKLGLWTQQVWGANSLVSWVNCSAQSVWRMLASENWVGVILPISWSGAYKLNGWEAKPGDVFIIDGKNEFTTTSTERRAVLIGIRRQLLARACASLEGAEHYSLGNGHRVLNVPAQSIRRFHQLVNRVYLAAGHLNALDNAKRMLPAHEEDFISDLAEWLVVSLPNAFDTRTSTPPDFQIVDRAMEAARQHDIEKATLAVLCEGAGVKKSTLHKAFMETHGISPMHFLLKTRLTACRECLLDPVLPPRSIKEVALRFGFVSFGRFSSYYKAQFGELPSETLARTKIRSGSLEL
jgi:AraC-like DNA-binding protein